MLGLENVLLCIMYYYEIYEIIVGTCFLFYLNICFSGKENVVVFDFLGKDSIRYYNEVPVEKRVFKNLTLFMENKKGEDDLFDRLNVSSCFPRKLFLFVFLQSAH